MFEGKIRIGFEAWWQNIQYTVYDWWQHVPRQGDNVTQEFVEPAPLTGKFQLTGLVGNVHWKKDHVVVVGCTKEPS